MAAVFTVAGHGRPVASWLLRRRVIVDRPGIGNGGDVVVHAGTAGGHGTRRDGDGLPRPPEDDLLYHGRGSVVLS